jgi:hypothetical protein
VAINGETWFVDGCEYVLSDARLVTARNAKNILNRNSLTQLREKNSFLVPRKWREKNFFPFFYISGKNMNPRGNFGVSFTSYKGRKILAGINTTVRAQAARGTAVA